MLSVSSQDFQNVASPSPEYLRPAKFKKIQACYIGNECHVGKKGMESGAFRIYSWQPKVRQSAADARVLRLKKTLKKQLIN
jgi:hypothetical protein